MAMRRSRGASPVTTLPPIRTSPRVGSSSPAIMRRRVVFPEPEGPRKTMNSPSFVSRSTSLTAPSSPCLKTLVRLRVSTTAIAPPRSLPLVEDALDLLLGGGGGFLRLHLVARRLGEHGGQHEGVEHLVDPRRGVAGVADVGSPVEDVAEHRVLLGRARLGVLGDELLQVRHRLGEAGEVVELAGPEGGP